MSRSSSKRRRRNTVWCMILLALVGTACLLYGIITLMRPEVSDVGGTSNPSHSVSLPVSSHLPPATSQWSSALSPSSEFHAASKGESHPASRSPESFPASSGSEFINAYIDVPVLLQDGLPTGCEATAAAMLLQAYGYPVTKEEIALAYPLTQQEMVNGRRYAAHPEEAFLGDPFTITGFGIFSPALTTIMQKAIDSHGGGALVKDLKGASEEEILDYIRSGTPVCIWSTMEGRDVVNQYSWYIKDGDVYTNQMYVWPGNEHCLVLTQYNKDQVVVNDPQIGVTQYDRADFFRHYREMGRYALVIV